MNCSPSEKIQCNTNLNPGNFFGGGNCQAYSKNLAGNAKGLF